MRVFLAPYESATSAALNTSEIALLLFGMLLVVGLVGEYAKSEPWKRHTRVFQMLVIIGVAGELLADGGIFLFSRRLQALAEVEVARLNLARVQIERQAADRDITPEEQKTLSAELSKFAGQRAVIDVFPVTFEHDFIAATIWGVLLDAHWKVGGVNMLSAPARRAVANLTFRPAPTLVQGLWIEATGDERSQAAAAALFKALKSTVAPGSLDPTPLANPADPRVWIYVGDKPTPLRSWVK